MMQGFWLVTLLRWILFFDYLLQWKRDEINTAKVGEWDVKHRETETPSGSWKREGKRFNNKTVTYKHANRIYFRTTHVFQDYTKWK